MNLYADSLISEGRRWVKIRTLSFGLLLLSASHKVLLSFFSCFLISMVLTAAVFSALLHGLWTYEQSGVLKADSFLITCVSIAAISLALIIWTLRERRMLEFFNVSKRIQSIMHLGDPPLSRSAETAASTADVDTLIRLIDQRLEARLAERFVPSDKEGTQGGHPTGSARSPITAVVE